MTSIFMLLLYAFKIPPASLSNDCVLEFLQCNGSLVVSYPVSSCLSTITEFECLLSGDCYVTWQNCLICCFWVCSNADVTRSLPHNGIVSNLISFHCIKYSFQVIHFCWGNFSFGFFSSFFPLLPCPTLKVQGSKEDYVAHSSCFVQIVLL